MTVGVLTTGVAVSIGTGTTKTLISPAAGMFMPADCKALLSVIPTISLATPTTTQGVSARLDVESQDLRGLLPVEILMPPIGAALGATVNTFEGQEEWKLNVPLGGGEGINAYGTASVANTSAPKAQAFFVVSNNAMDMIHPLTRQTIPQRHYKLGTFTSTGAVADTAVTGTKYSFSGGRAIVELMGIVHYKTVQATDYVMPYMNYNSSEFIDAIPVNLPMYPMCYGLGTTGEALIPGVSRQEVNVPLKLGQVNIQDTLFWSGALNTAGSFWSGVSYI